MSAPQKTDQPATQQHRHRGDLSSRDVHLGYTRLVRSEWIKFRSIRSTFWCYAVIAFLTLGLAVLLGSVSEPSTAEQTAVGANATIVSINTVSVYLTALVVGVLGVLIISGEYATGQIRSTFTADPGRVGVLAAKATVLAVTTFIVSAVANWIGVAISTALQAGKGLEPDLADPSVWMPILGASIDVTLLALLAFGIGLLVRSSAGGIAITLGILLVLPVVISLVAALANLDWLNDVAKFLPDAAGAHLYQFDTGAPAPKGLTLNGWSGGGVLLAEVVVVNAFAMTVAKRRDV
ncbi:ABC transporter permease subunit [Curtobacterium herbarum]|uniref:ABC transporter permease subunit n=1 Tax=Curtobacterium herbarum TaxID=150122 RepID=A0ABN1ZE55_9MICO|nr:ABC transporter permease subunit [Curtobacterium herbarum]MBM7474718.1 ABC-2 type transport system permease protein [Curtobacterium herbarum]MCS6545368.1 ABC transporter permease [Curtobacterium herbarum]